MRIMKFFSILLLTVTLGMQSGCTPQNELGNLSVVTGYFLDGSRGEFLLVADCLDFSGQPQDGGLKTKKIHIRKASLEKAFAELKKQSQSPLCFSRAKVFLVSKTMLQQSENKILEELFHLRVLPSDIVILQTNLTAQTLTKENDSAFTLSLGSRLNNQEIFSSFQLYQLIKKPTNRTEIPTVFLSENGLYINLHEDSKQKEGGL